MNKQLQQRFKMKHKDALKIALDAKAQLEPHCYKIAIAGSVRRHELYVKDIEIVIIPKPYTPGDIMKDNLATVVNNWQKIKGSLPCKYTQRLLPQGIKLDLFFATPTNWGLVYATRTGPAEYSHKVLATGWVKRGYKSVNGYLTKNGEQIPVYNEIDLYDLLGIDWVNAKYRQYI